MHYSKIDPSIHTFGIPKFNDVIKYTEEQVYGESVGMSDKKIGDVFYIPTASYYLGKFKYGNTTFSIIRSVVFDKFSFFRDDGVNGPLPKEIDYELNTTADFLWAKLKLEMSKTYNNKQKKDTKTAKNKSEIKKIKNKIV
jgi:hypothetical protein